MTLGLTFDTGALIALERRSARMGKVLYEARERRMRITVPAAVLAEWWRGTSRRRDDIRECFDVEPLEENVAKLAGEALAALARATVIDAIVMASASLRGAPRRRCLYQRRRRSHGATDVLPEHPRGSHLAKAAGQQLTNRR